MSVGNVRSFPTGLLKMKGTVSQSLLDSPGDEDRRSREAGALVRELRSGESRERAREGGGRRKRTLEKNVEGRRSRGAQECLSSELVPCLQNSPWALIKQSTLESLILGWWSLPRNTVGDRWP